MCTFTDIDGHVTDDLRDALLIIGIGIESRIAPDDRNGLSATVDGSVYDGIAADVDVDVTVYEGLSCGLRVTSVDDGTVGCVVLPHIPVEDLLETSATSSEDVVEDSTSGDIDHDVNGTVRGSNGSTVSSAVHVSDGSTFDIDVDLTDATAVDVAAGTSYERTVLTDGPCVVSRTEEGCDLG